MDRQIADRQMTVTSNRAAHRSGSPAPPPDGALVRLSVASEDDLAGVPRAPADVSVSFSSPRAAAAASALEALGYRAVGVSPGWQEQAVAHFLVPQRVIEQHPTWWRSLADRADQTFSLAAGPVQVAFADVLRTHREPLR